MVIKMSNGYPTMVGHRSFFEEIFGGKFGWQDVGFATYTILPIFLGPIALLLAIVDGIGYFVVKKKKYKTWLLIAGVVHGIAGLTSVVGFMVQSKGWTGLTPSGLSGLAKVLSGYTWSGGKVYNYFAGIKAPTLTSLEQLTGVSGLGTSAYGFF